MCGLAGFIGDSKNPRISYQLITKLFEKAEMRGKCAAGFWGTKKGSNIIYHKEPIRASLLIKKDVWQNVAGLNPNLMLVHAREASSGVGLPTVNKNNHPFVSADGNIALVHNGRIYDPEHSALRQKYKTNSDCDSEILLRVFESGKAEKDAEVSSDEVSSRLSGLQDIWSFLSRSHGQYPPAMAVAIGEKSDNIRRLWLFRNDFRTLWAIDLREPLGQIFFCSTEEMWHYGLSACPEIQSFLNKFTIKLVELPPEEIWLLETSPDNPIVDDKHLQKFVVSPYGDFESWNYEGDSNYLSPRTFSEDVITALDDEDELRLAQEQEDEYLQLAQDDEHLFDAGRTTEKLCCKISEVSLDIKALSIMGGRESKELDDLNYKLQLIYNNLSNALKGFNNSSR